MLNKREWIASHGTTPLTHTWRDIGWTWQPVPCKGHSPSHILDTGKAIREAR